MGYRLYVTEEPEEYNGKNVICFGKLYGYVSNNLELKSCKFLIKLSKKNGFNLDAFSFEHSCGFNNFPITVKNFITFLELYINDKINSKSNDSGFKHFELTDYEKILLSKFINKEIDDILYLSLW